MATAKEQKNAKNPKSEKEQREAALQDAMDQIQKQFGQGAITSVRTVYITCNLSKCLRHQSGMKTYVIISHVAFNFGFRN